MESRPLAAAPAGSGLREIPGDAGLPLLGHTLQILRDPLGAAHARVTRHGTVSWGRFLGRTVVSAIGPDAAETVFLNRDKTFANGPAWSFFIGPFFYRGIMLLDFDEHIHHRRIMQQAFAKKRLVGYQVAMAPEIAASLDRWQPSSRFLVRPNIKQLTLDLATEVFVGLELSRAEADKLNRAFIDAVQAGTAVIRYPVPGLRWWKGLRARKVLEEFFHSHLPDKRLRGGDDLFAALCEAQTDDGHRFTDEDVVNHMIFVLMAAHDTTTIVLTSMMYYLAKHPAWQERLRAESQSVGKPVLEHGDLDSMTGIDLVMKEALRLVSPVPSMPRHAVRDTDFLGFHLPAGTTVLVSPNVNHHLPEYWPEPDRFDPERFSPERREDRVHPFAWEPFGGGAHKCIGLHFAGMQIKSIMHQLLLRYRWSVPSGYTWNLDITSLPYPKDGLPVQLYNEREW